MVYNLGLNSSLIYFIFIFFFSLDVIRTAHTFRSIIRCAAFFPLLFSDRVITSAIYRYMENWMPMVVNCSPNDMLNMGE